MITRLLRTATVATLPRWQRRLANLQQPRVVDAFIRPVMRPAFRLLAQPKISLLALKLISSSTVPVVAPALLGTPPRRAEVLTPADAFARHLTPTPAELYAQSHPE